MDIDSPISWEAPRHIHTSKNQDWYWSVGIITLALATVAFLFGNPITGIFILLASTVLVMHASRPPSLVRYEINDRGIMMDETLYPFLTLESFWIPHDDIPKILIKSRKTFMPLIVIYIHDIDPEKVREVLLTYIAETEHHEPILIQIMEKLGF
jgi:hypothetical protein